MNLIIEDAFNKLNEKDGDITESLEYIIYSITQYELFDVVKLKALDLCMDMYGDLGKLMREINENQDQLWKNLAERALYLCKHEE